MFARTLVSIVLSLLCAGSAAAQSLASIAAASYEGAAGPWVAKYVGATPGSLAPELDVTGWLNRQPTTLRKLRDEPVLVYFWSAWCAACPEGLAKLQRLARTTHAPLEIITVRLSDRNGLPAGAGKSLTTLPVAIDQGGTARAYGIKAVPACVLIDPKGFIRFVHIRLPTAQEIDAVAGLSPRATPRGITTANSMQ
jgi:thiol-disulfide isomerase/thioredoxin